MMADTIDLSTDERDEVLGCMRTAIVDHWGEAKTLRDWGITSKQDRKGDLAMLEERAAEATQSLYDRIARSDPLLLTEAENIGYLLAAMRKGMERLWGQAAFVRQMARDPRMAPIIKRHADAAKVIYQRIETLRGERT